MARRLHPAGAMKTKQPLFLGLFGGVSAARINRRTVSTGVASLLAFSFASLACTTTTTTTANMPADDGGVAAMEPEVGIADGDDASTEAADSATPKTPKLSCGDSETKTACDQCCRTFNPAGNKVYGSTSIEIVCRDTVCRTACAATFCASPRSNPDATCRECWDAALPAFAKEFFATCSADADCASYAACLDGARCSTKPK